MILNVLKNGYYDFVLYHGMHCTRFDSYIKENDYSLVASL